jgi:hypothetical protein
VVLSQLLAVIVSTLFQALEHLRLVRAPELNQLSILLSLLVAKEEVIVHLTLVAIAVEEALEVLEQELYQVQHKHIRLLWDHSLEIIHL